MKYERCCKCDSATGKAGAGEDSLYTETDGPFCEKCFPEKQEQGEPYGYFRYDIRLDAWVQSRNSNQGVGFYTTPQPAQKPWVGLTDEEIFETHKQVDSMQYLTFGKVIEAKLKEKNT